MVGVLATLTWQCESSRSVKPLRLGAGVLNLTHSALRLLLLPLSEPGESYCFQAGKPLTHPVTPTTDRHPSPWTAVTTARRVSTSRHTS